MGNAGRRGGSTAEQVRPVDPLLARYDEEEAPTTVTMTRSSSVGFDSCGGLRYEDSVQGGKLFRASLILVFCLSPRALKSAVQDDVRRQKE